MQLTALPFRLACVVSSRAQAVDDRTGQPAVLWNGNRARMDCGLFLADSTREENLIDDLSNLTLARLVLREENARGTILRTITTETFDDTLDLAAWQSGAKQHFSFELSPAEALFVIPTGQNSLTLWMAVEVVTAAPEPITVATGPLTVREDGIGAEPLPDPPPLAHIRVGDTGLLELYNADEDTWYRVEVSGTPAQVTLTPITAP